MVLNYSSFVIDPKWDQGVVFFSPVVVELWFFFPRHGHSRLGFDCSPQVGPLITPISGSVW